VQVRSCKTPFGGPVVPEVYRRTNPLVGLWGGGESEREKRMEEGLLGVFCGV
jgi:hypothetical protein